MSTIAAIATAQAAAGLGTIKISGEEALLVADRVFSSVSGKKLQDMKGYNALYGKVHDGEPFLTMRLPSFSEHLKAIRVKT